MNLSVVIPNYNGKQLLAKNLPQVLKVLPGAEVIIVDDSSNDGSVDFIKKNFPRVKLIEKITNSGFATTVNLGVKTARHSIVLLLNSDAVPQKDFYIPALKHFNDDNIFAVGCLDESLEDGQVIRRGRGVGKFTRGFLMHERGEANNKHTLWVSGGSSFFKKEIWEKLGGMDEIYNPFYWEDIDLSYRAMKSGFRILFEPESKVNHFHNEGSIKENFTQKRIKEIAYRNQIIFVWKNITDVNLLLNHFLFLPYHLLKITIKDGSVFIKALCQVVWKLPQIIKKRALQRKIFCKTDNDVLSIFY